MYSTTHSSTWDLTCINFAVFLLFLFQLELIVVGLESIGNEAQNTSLTVNVLEERLVTDKFHDVVKSKAHGTWIAKSQVER